MQIDTLPAEVTSFVGRGTEVADVCRLLAGGRLVTILGPGGVGKTRAAFRVARQAADRYPDGVAIVELSELTDPELLPNTVAASLGLGRQEARQQLHAVLDYLCSRRLLLVLDTCEHMVEACALFAESVLREARDVTILATSRQPLDAPGEHTYHLSPLPVPGDDRGPGAAFAPVPFPRSLTGAGDAAELFVQRAAAADPRFEVTAADWPDIVRVCRRLDGMPLAIELAAVRVRVLTLRALADLLDERYDMLARRRGGTTRHQTLESAIEWSFDLCTEAERTLWTRLSVFAGTFDVAAARDVCSDAGLPRGEILPALIGLADKSVVLRDGGRYRMLDTIREFGAGRLAASGQDANYRGRHVAWYLEAARSFAGHFLDHDQPERVGALRVEHGNLRAAMQYALSSDSERLVRDGAELATALYGYWMVSGLLREGRHWLGLALDRLPRRLSRDRAWVLAVRAFLGPVAGETTRAVAEASDAVEIARELGDDDLLLGRACLSQLFALMFACRVEEALTAGAEARKRLERVNDRIGLLILQGQMGHLHSLAGNLPAAVEACERSLDMLREGSETGEIGEQWVQGFVYLNAGLVRYFQGDHEGAARCCGHALSIQVGLQDINGCAYALEGLGWLAAGKERWCRAAWLLGGADTLWRHLGARLGNNVMLEDLHRQMADAARRGLGGERFGELFAEGARSPLDQLARLAIDDAEDLPRANESRTAPKNSCGALTRREQEIADLITGGLSNPEVAARLSISRRTVDAHVAHIYAKLGVTSRVQLVALLLDGGAASRRSKRAGPLLGTVL